MASKQGGLEKCSTRRKAARTCSPDERLPQTEEDMESTLGDTDSVNSDDSVSVLSQICMSNVTRQNAVPATDHDSESSSESSQEKIVSEWSVAEVRNWAFNIFENDSIAANFENEEINGKILLSSTVRTDQAMDQLGLNTIGKKAKFLETVKELEAVEGSQKASLQMSTVEYKKVEGKSSNGKGKLSLSDIKQLDQATKQIYLSVRARIRRATEEEFPGNDIPTFRSNPDAKMQLEKLVKHLTKSCSISEVNFGEDGIRSHILSVLNERRRMVSLGHSFEKKRKSSSDSDQDNEPLLKLKKQNAFTPSSSSTSQSNSDCDGEDIPVEAGKLTLKSAEVVLMCVFKEQRIRDVKLQSQMLPACRFLKVSGVRGKPKPMITRALAEALINKNYVYVGESANKANLTLSDIEILPEKDILEDVKEWQEAKSANSGSNIKMPLTTEV